MVRAELGNGNRDHAISLIRRVQERYVSTSIFLTPIDKTPRQYPESIVSRISGIMIDDVVSPWASAPSSEADNIAPSGSNSP
jgi:hypothetical protein